ncbi:MAG TPA: site-specific integrase [Polyangiaceae bacterium]|jgi:site-specific recombinase XerD
MKEACVAVTRGGVTYRISKPAPVPQAFDWLRIGDRSHRIAEPAQAENSNAGPPATHASEVLGRLRKALDLTDEDDLRAGAMLAVLCAGVRKNELCGLDVSDLREVDGVLSLRIRRTRQPSRAKERVVLLSAETSAMLRRYWVHERLAQEPPDAPLFWTLGRHGRCQRTRVTGHAVIYWLEQLRRRAGLTQRLTSRALRRPAQGSVGFRQL